MTVMIVRSVAAVLVLFWALCNFGEGLQNIQIADQLTVISEFAPASVSDASGGESVRPAESASNARELQSVARIFRALSTAHILLGGLGIVAGVLVVVVAGAWFLYVAAGLQALVSLANLYFAASGDMSVATVSVALAGLLVALILAACARSTARRRRAAPTVSPVSGSDTRG